MNAHRLFALVLASTIAAFTLASHLPAEAHEFDPERQLVVQVFPDHVDILILYTEAPGERSELFTALFGFGAFGEFGDELEELAKQAFLPRMLDGLEFEVVGEQPRTQEPELRFEDHDGHLMAAAFVRYDVETLDDRERRTFVVRARDRSFLDTSVTIYGGDGLRILPDGPLVQRVVEPMQFDLLRGQDRHITFSHR